MKNAFKGLFLVFAIVTLVTIFLMAYSANLAYLIATQRQETERLELQNDSLRHQVEIRKDLTRVLDTKIKAKQKERRAK
jgi:hypothetical protein